MEASGASAQGEQVGSVVDRLRAAGGALTPAERKVADAVASDPQLVAFGTVADVAERSGSSGATVMRLAARLGFDGFAELQEAVRSELADRLRPAAERIRTAEPGDLVGRAIATSVHAVEATLGNMDRAAFDDAVALLSDAGRSVVVVAGDAGAGVAAHAAEELQMLRPHVHLAGGTPVGVGRTLAGLDPGDVVVALDLRRYDRWLLQAVDHAVGSGAELVALTDGPLSPLARQARALIVIEGEGLGPFDNYVGALAVLSALVAGVAEQLREAATDQLDRIEGTWRAIDALTDG